MPPIEEILLEEKPEQVEEERRVGKSLKERVEEFKNPKGRPELTFAALDSTHVAEEADPSCMSRKDLKRYYKQQRRNG